MDGTGAGVEREGRGKPTIRLGREWFRAVPIGPPLFIPFGETICHLSLLIKTPSPTRRPITGAQDNESLGTRQLVKHCYTMYQCTILCTPPQSPCPGSLGGILGYPGGLLGRKGLSVRAPLLGPSWAVLGALWAVLGLSWAVFGAS